MNAEISTGFKNFKLKYLTNSLLAVVNNILTLKAGVDNSKDFLILYKMVKWKFRVMSITIPEQQNYMMEKLK